MKPVTIAKGRRPGTLSAMTLVIMFSVPAGAGEADTITRLQTRVAADAVQSTTENTREITRQDMDEQQVHNLDDLVRYMPGVEVDDIGRFGTLGFNIRGMDGDRVAVTVDGLSLGETYNPPSYAAYDFFSAGRGGVDVDALKAVQVVKGADVIAAGSGALGGAVIFVTKDAADYLNAEGNDTHVGLKAGYISASDETAVTGTLANRTGPVETLLVYTGRRGHEMESYHSSRSSRNIPGTAREIPDPLDYRNHNLLFKIHYHPADQHRLGLTVENYESSSELDARSRLNDAYLTRTSDDEVQRRRFGVDYRWQAGTVLFDELEWRYDYQRSYGKGLTLMTIPSGCPAGAATPPVDPCLRTEDRDYEQIHHRTVLRLDKLLDDHQVSYGLSAERKDIDFSHVLTRYVGTTPEVGVGWPQQGQELVPDTRIEVYSLYLRDQVGLVDDRLLLNAGVRFDRYDYSPSLGANYQDASGTVRDVSFSSPGWQLGASWTLRQGHQIWAQAGGGFRAPTVEDMYFLPSTTGATEVSTGELVDLWNQVSNPGLKAETSRTLEVGYRWQGPRHLFGVSVYRNDYDDFIEYATRIRNPDTEYETCTAAGVCTRTFGNEYSTPDNIGKVEVEGVEVEGQWLFGDNVMLRFAYAWNEGEDDDGRPIESVSPASGTVGLSYQAPDGRWGVETRVLHSPGKKLKDTRQEGLSPFSAVPARYFTDGTSYTVVDLLGRLSITPQLTLNLSVHNLFDERYIRWQRIRFVNEGSAAGGVRGGVSEDGINRYTEPGRNYRMTVAYRF